jgi:hypothetical protein
MEKLPIRLAQSLILKIPKAVYPSPAAAVGFIPPNADAPPDAKA